MKPSMKRNAGFTLIELMIVVAIIGILSMLAMTGYKGYMASAKGGEAKSSLGQIGKLALATFEKGVSGDTAIIATGLGTAGIRQFCPSVDTTIPTAVPKGVKYQSATSDWTGHAGFNCLGFSMTGPQYFAYGFNVSAVPTSAAPAQNFAAWAVGDLNADGAVTTLKPATAGTAAASDATAANKVSYYAINGGFNTSVGATLAPTLVEAFVTE